MDGMGGQWPEKAADRVAAKVRARFTFDGSCFKGRMQ